MSDDNQGVILNRSFIKSFETSIKSHDLQINSVTNFQAFQQHWSDVFKKLAEDCKGDGNKFISNPPLKKLELHLIPEVEKRECPCCYYGEDSTHDIECDEGITEEKFILNLRELLYGDNNRLSDTLNNEFRGGLKVVGFDWMIGSGKFLMSNSLWVYCDGKRWDAKTG